MGTPRETDKALRYISQLDGARCAGRWHEIPELTRKVAKHAPHRRCLVLTARSEAQIADYATHQPSTAASTTSAGLTKLIPELITVIDEEGDHVQDTFQAIVCLGWLHYELGEPALAAAKLPKNMAAVASKLKNGDASGWTHVCLVKGTYIKGAAQEKTTSAQEAINTYRSILPWLSFSKTSPTETPQSRTWTERLLVRMCLLADQSAATGDLFELKEALSIFRTWAKFWDGVANTGSGGQEAARFRRLAWKAYYDTLSLILRHGLPYKAESAGTDVQDFGKEKATSQTHTMRLQQRAELKRVEAVYESLLLKETQFPKASERNEEVEAWVDAVMDNWRVLCGPTWHDQDLGEGGKSAVARGILDILYRAATKTFHSTKILRFLFVVHASLAEFELAFKAYDSYVEIITHGIDRAEKTGEKEVGIDDDSTILRTSAEAIRILCRFGSRKEAEKALEVGEHIEHWLEQALHIQSRKTGETLSVLQLGIVPRALSVAYGAIGVSLAHWARFTYKADSRTDIQKKALLYLRKSLEEQYEDPHNVEILYALGLLLAEMRDIPGAMKVVKVALSSSNKLKTSVSVDGVMSGGLLTEFGRERKLIPFWHLLALLLTARSDFSAAEQACENAFEQFGDPHVLFGTEDGNAPFRSEHLIELSPGHGGLGLVDQMEFYEKSGILQIKMTQLALVELVEGSHSAVDLSDELLGLYNRLFGDPTKDKPKLIMPPPASPPPKSIHGSIRGSIFRSKSRRSQTNESVARNSSIASSQPSTVATHTTAAPTIHVTDENGSGDRRGRMGHHKHQEGHTVKRSPSKLQKRSSASLRRKSETESDSNNPANGTPGRTKSTREKSPARHSRANSKANSVRKSYESNERPLRPIAHNMSPKSQPPPAGQHKQPPRQDVRLPAAFPHPNYVAPDPHFTSLQERRQKVTLLVQTWIFISELYTNAEMYEDAKGAVEEALKIVQTFEVEVAQETPSAQGFADPGWGGGKSVDELYGDIYAARGEILMAQTLKHEARADFELALMHYPDHPAAIVGVSNVLLDIFRTEIPLEPGQGDAKTAPSVKPRSPHAPHISEGKHSKDDPGQKHHEHVFRDHDIPHHTEHHAPSSENNISPPELTRITARDRAFMLLSNLTKLGSGWDCSEAWYALARAYEESGQLDKTKEVLWWCVELEDTHPVRNWRSVTLGGFVL